MQTTAAGLRRIKAFAQGAGVTVRTLHLYDRLDLLKPAATSESGYRLYGDAQLERLEHIVALRFVGFSLDQIKELLAGSDLPLVEALRVQHEVIARQKRRLELALAAIAEAELALGDARADRWQTLRNVIEVFKMQNDWEWTREYYSEESRRKLEEAAQRMGPAAIEESQREWSELIAQVEAAVAQRVAPSSPQAQELAQRWRALLARFTQGDPEIQSGLNRLYSDATHWPKDFKRPWSDAAEAFIKAAVDCGAHR